jgi:hypothetical protein
MARVKRTSDSSRGRKQSENEQDAKIQANQLEADNGDELLSDEDSDTLASWLDGNEKVSFDSLEEPDQAELEKIEETAEAEEEPR